MMYQHSEQKPLQYDDTSKWRDARRKNQQLEKTRRDKELKAQYKQEQKRLLKMLMLQNETQEPNQQEDNKERSRHNKAYRKNEREKRHRDYLMLNDNYQIPVQTSYNNKSSFSGRTYTRSSSTHCMQSTPVGVKFSGNQTATSV
jgi:phage-related minor tail protein